MLIESPFLSSCSSEFVTFEFVAVFVFSQFYFRIVVFETEFSAVVVIYCLKFFVYLFG